MTTKDYERITARIGMANFKAELERMRNITPPLLQDVPFKPGKDGLYTMKIAMPGSHKGKGGKRGKGGKKGGGKKGGGRKGY